MIIIGGGPSGLLLSQLLHRKDIDTIILERKTRDYVLGRIRAGILGTGFVDLMREAGAVERLDKESFVHDGTIISYGEEQFNINFKQYTNKSVAVYGQTEVTSIEEILTPHFPYSTKERKILTMPSTCPS